jgi:hypothetical protein
VVLGFLSQVARAAPMCGGAGSTTNAYWTGSNGGSGPYPPSNDTSFTCGTGCNPAFANSSGHTFTTSGTNLYAFENDTGNLLWGPVTPSGNTIQNFVIPVVLNDGVSEVIFLANQDGNLYKYNAVNGNQLWAASIVGGGDQLMATPTVWLYQFGSTTMKDCVSNRSPAFRCKGSGALRTQCGTTHTATLPGQNPNCYCGASGNDDLVFVITYKASTSDNEVLALCAKDHAFFWQFHPGPLGTNEAAAGMNEATDGAYINYTRDELYFGTLSTGATQSSLWELDAVTGQLKQQRYFGSIKTRPEFKVTDVTNNASCGSTCPLIYFGTDTGMLEAVRADTFGMAGTWGTYDSPWVWRLAVSSAHPYKRSVWAEFRSGSSGSYIVNSIDDADINDGNIVKGFMKVVVDHSTTHLACGTGGCPASPCSGGCTVPGSIIWSDRMSLGGVSGMAAVNNSLGQAFVGTADGKIREFELSTDTIDATATVSEGAVTISDVALDVSSPAASSINRLAVNVGGHLKEYCSPWQSPDATTSSAPLGPEPHICTPPLCPPCQTNADCQGSGNACSTTCSCPGATGGGSCLITETQSPCQCPGQPTTCRCGAGSTQCTCQPPTGAPPGTTWLPSSCTCSVAGGSCNCPPPTCTTCPTQGKAAGQDPLGNEICTAHGQCLLPWAAGDCKAAVCGPDHECYSTFRAGASKCTYADTTRCAYQYVTSGRCQCPTGADGKPQCGLCESGSMNCNVPFSQSCSNIGDTCPSTDQICCGGGKCLTDSQLQTDPNNCGGCGIVCPPGVTGGGVCQSGSCVCTPGETYCPADESRTFNANTFQCDTNTTAQCVDTSANGGPFGNFGRSCNCGGCGFECDSCCVTTPTGFTFCCPRGTADCMGQGSCS